MEDQQRQYRPCSPTMDFWLALLHVRNYMFEDPVFAHFVLAHYQHPHQLATDFWVVDKWLDCALLTMNEDSLIATNEVKTAL